MAGLCVTFHLFSVDVISDASFSENFYGLRRVSCNVGAADASVTHVIGDKVQHLTRTERRRSLCFLVSELIILCST